MAEKEHIIKVWLMKPKEAWWQLSEEERNDISRKIDEKLVEVGGKNILTCTPYWSNEECAMIGAQEFPNIEAVQEFAQFLWETNERYTESKTYLCTRWPQE